MTTIGAERLLTDHGNYDKVAEAWLEGRLTGLEQRYVTEIVNKTDLEAARIRIEMRKSSTKLFTVSHKFNLTRTLKSQVDFVVLAVDEKEALNMAQEARTTDKRYLEHWQLVNETWEVTEHAGRVVRR